MNPEQKQQRRSRFLGSAISFIALLVTVAILTAIAFWAFDYILVAAIIGTAATALLLLLIVLVTAQVTRYQTIETMQIGADIALQAQHNVNGWDARKTKTIGDVMREGIKFSREQAKQSGSSQPLPPLLPPPSQDSRWLPAMANYGDDEFIEMEEDV